MIKLNPPFYLALTLEFLKIIINIRITLRILRADSVVPRILRLSKGGKFMTVNELETNEKLKYWYAIIMK